jgi:hypothetical protein
MKKMKIFQSIFELYIIHLMNFSLWFQTEVVFKEMNIGLKLINCDFQIEGDWILLVEVCLEVSHVLWKIIQNGQKKEIYSLKKKMNFDPTMREDSFRLQDKNFCKYLKSINIHFIKINFLNKLP